MVRVFSIDVLPIDTPNKLKISWNLVRDRFDKDLHSHRPPQGAPAANRGRVTGLWPLKIPYRYASRSTAVRYSCVIPYE